MATETVPCSRCGTWNKVEIENKESAVCGKCKEKLIVTYYELFEISQTASSDEIKKAYRKLALKWHPDQNKSSSAETMFKLVNEAYSVLMNSEQRQKYDSYLKCNSTNTEKQNYSAPNVDPNQSEQIFILEMLSLANELAFANKNWNKIYPELIKRGCPESIAQYVAQSCVAYRKSIVRKAFLKPFIIGLLWLAFGGLITVGSYNAASPGGSYMVMGGAIIFGGYQMIKALYFLITGNVPEEYKNRQQIISEISKHTTGMKQ